MHKTPPHFFVQLAQMFCALGEGEDRVEEGFLLFKRATDNFLFSLEAKAYKKQTSREEDQRVVPNILTAGFIVMSGRATL